ncbi:uncharacterized protein [Bemisia tabaci]|uniref:uncharacterized protein isoform X2 n=1 Tax=Bemisia tabaci TaxID=7038 RepID=UPI003B27CF9B
MSGFKLRMASGEDHLNILLIIIFIVATTSNSLLLLVFYRRPSLRTLSNRFVINLLITNLVSCWTLLPLILVDNIWSSEQHQLATILQDGADGANPGALYASIMCYVNQGISTGLCAASILSILLIGIDQYLAVVDPLRYHSRINQSRSGWMIAVVWLVSFLLGLLGSLIQNNKATFNVCAARPVVADPGYIDTVKALFSVIYFLCIFLVPFVSICIIYISIYTAALRNSQRARKNGSSSGYFTPPLVMNQITTSSSDNSLNTCAKDTNQLIKAASNPSFAPGQLAKANAAAAGGQDSELSEVTVPILQKQSSVESNIINFTAPPTKPELVHSSTRSSLKSTSSSLVSTLKYRISNASLFRYREESRAARISVLVIIMSLICWLPFNLILLVNSSLFKFSYQIPHYLFILSLVSLVLSAIISPLLFAHRNRRIHNELLKICLVKRSNNFYKKCNNRHKKINKSNFKLKTNYSQTALEIFNNHLDNSNISEHSQLSNSNCNKSCSPDENSNRSNKMSFDLTNYLNNFKNKFDFNHKRDSIILDSDNFKIYEEKLLPSSNVNSHFIQIPEVALDIDTSRSSFSSGGSGSSSAYRTLSTTSMSDIVEDEPHSP